MRLTKKKNCENTIRKVWDDDKTECLGVVGTVEDMLRQNLLEYCDYDPKTWCFLSNPDSNKGNWFGATREEVLKHL